MCSIKIFYSWQSDDAHTRNVIRSQIEKSIKHLASEGLAFEIIEDARTENGAEHIETGVLESIAKSDVFIGDVTPVTSYQTKEGKTKLSPNGNVLFECGFAIRHLSDGLVKLICRLEDGDDISSLPFDINHRKLLTFSNKNRNSLNNIEDWLRSKAELIKRKRQELAMPDAVILFEGYDSEIELSPAFERVTYVSPISLEHQNQMPQSAAVAKASTGALMEHIDKFNMLRVQPTTFKPITRRIDASLIEVHFIIENKSSSALDNCEIQIWTNNEELLFEESPIMEKYRMPIPKSKDDFFIYEDRRHGSRHIDTINPGMALSLGYTYLSLPYEAGEYTINWYISTRSGESSGTLKIISSPIFTDSIRESEHKAGTIEMFHIIKDE